jgi:hypothetical protein
LEDRISDLETEIEELEEAAYGAILTIPADGIEEGFRSLRSAKK